MTQKQMIIAHFLEGKSITSGEAFKMGIGRLASRINDIKEDGIPVRDQFIKVQKANGQTTLVKEYWLDPMTIKALLFIKGEEIE